MQTISFNIKTLDKELVLRTEDITIYFDGTGLVRTENCPAWVLTKAITVCTNIYKAVDIITEREETNTWEVLEFLVKGFSPTAIKQLMDNYNKDEFILGTYNDVAYPLPKYIYKLITTYEERSGEDLNIYFPSNTIRTLEEVYNEIEEINNGLTDSDDIKFTIASFINGEYIAEMTSSILFGQRKLSYTKSSI